MNGQDPNNLGNNINKNNEGNATVLGNMSAQALGPMPSAPNTPGAPTNAPIPPVTPQPQAPSNPTPPMPTPSVAQPQPMQTPQPQPAVNPGLNGQSGTPMTPPTPGVQANVVNVPQNPVPPKEPAIVNPSGQVVNPAPNPTPQVGQAQPIPGVAPTQNNGTSTGTDPVIAANTNGFVEPNKAENIGMMPPSQDQKKETKPMNKVLFIVLIVVLIAGVAYGVYYYLSVSKTKIEVTPKSNIEVSVGEVLSTNPSDYATIVGTSPANCTLEGINNIDTSKAGSHEYTIKCNDKAYKGTITIKDTTGPTLGVNLIYKTVGSTMHIDELVNKCEDESGCTYEFQDAQIANGYLNNAGGPNEIGIKATDSSGNTTTENAILYVVPYDIKFFNLCSSTPETKDTYTKTISDRFAIGTDGLEFISLGASRREYKFEFTNQAAYQNAIGDKPNTLTFEEITGFAEYDDAALTFIVSNDLNTNTLNTEAGGMFPTKYMEIRNYYEKMGLTCNVDQLSPVE